MPPTDRRDPLSVDWVLLGMYGWDIEPTGAGYYGLNAAEQPDGTSLGHPGCDPWANCHLDRTTLDLMGSGPPEFWLERIAELQMAGLWPWCTIPANGNTIQMTTTYHWGAP